MFPLNHKTPAPDRNLHMTSFGMELARWTVEGLLGLFTIWPARGRRLRAPAQGIPTGSSVGPLLRAPSRWTGRSATIIVRRHHGNSNITLLL
jgi:hypothetical protein